MKVEHAGLLVFNGKDLHVQGWTFTLECGERLPPEGVERNLAMADAVVRLMAERYMQTQPLTVTADREAELLACRAIARAKGAAARRPWWKFWGRA